ncbi:MAG: molybdenum cofactor biosynthesis protein MoaE [Actinobacteria bacterium]|nr:molybdenum cofactor biosynthesis protein MoaE [Actinomycetota bacterium]
MAETFTAEVRLFAWLAEMARSRTVSIEIPHGALATSVVSRALRAAGLSQSIGVTGVARLAVNKRYAAPGDVIKAGDELALIPPVSGGSGPHVRITPEPLDVTAMYTAVTTPDSGAVVVFSGTAHGADRLYLEAYEEMALLRIEEIADQLMRRYRLEAVAIEHRVGDVPPPEPTVVVAVSALQPSAAFSAAHEAIDRIKVEAPIWRLEIDDGFRSWDRGDPKVFMREA